MEPPDGLALAILQSEDSRDTHLRRDALPELHALILQFLAAAFEIPGVLATGMHLHIENLGRYQWIQSNEALDVRAQSAGSMM